MLYELVNRIGVDRVMTYNRGESTVIVNCLDYLIKSKKAVFLWYRRVKSNIWLWWYHCQLSRKNSKSYCKSYAL